MAQKEGKSAQVVKVSKTDCEARGYDSPFISPSDPYRRDAVQYLTLGITRNFLGS